MSRPHEEVERGLMAIALSNGSPTHAHRLLAGEGLTIPVETLRSWKYRDHVQRYEEIRAREMPRIKQLRAERHAALAEKQADLAEVSVDRLREAIDRGELKPHQLGGVMHQANVGSGIHTDKARDLRGDATVVIEDKRTHEEIIRNLVDKGVLELGPDDVIEVPDSEVPDSEEKKLTDALPPASYSSDSARGSGE